MKSNKQLVTLSTLLAVTAVLVSAGCKREDSASTSAEVDSPSKGYGFVPTRTNQVALATNDVDNTRVNVRDRADQTLTAGDQGGTEADRDITQQIRKGLTDDNALSTTAKNVKIITTNRKVTLRGPVNTEAEKTSIASLAKSIAGEGNVEDELEVKANP
jgi:hyperosmotically inducible protein